MRRVSGCVCTRSERCVRIPVLTIDGPSGSGKGTVARSVAQRLGFHLLDSGAVYRALAVDLQRAGLTEASPDQIANRARGLALSFDGAGRACLAGELAEDQLRTEASGLLASRIAAWPQVRAALLDRQLAFRQPPGLVADGRDMGTVVFADAEAKVFLTASANERARRRHKQLIEKGLPANIVELLADIHARDRQDTERTVAPLRAASDALTIDSTALPVDAVVDRILAHAVARGFRV